MIIIRDSTQLNEETAMFLDAILMIMVNTSIRSTGLLQLELLRCGFFVSQPELKKALSKLKEDGYVSTEDKPEDAGAWVRKP